ncbi:hypothetical protein HPO96_09885 [Kribbella sandramycini]|uniref:Putative membrane protein n=1 Tax=Kribbella sandramycini TaxID=60450 RepID=A0A7Y4KXM9_9ACTN|nr:hypothetical protein [Kribbella sandramycini]MBB6569613.1 putative membrane protein [Kribbella sandramycini]NOL40553.1 hypothetical protein [Kribbella sandramycini]
MTTVALVLLLVAAAWSAPVLARPTLPFGVRVPRERASDVAIRRVRRRYSHGVLSAGVLSGLALVVVPARVVLPVLAGALLLIGYHAHRSVAVAKRAGDWYAGLRQAVSADSSLRTDPVRPPWLMLLPAVLIALATAVVGIRRYDALPPTLPTPNGLVVDAGVRSSTTVTFAFATVTAQLLVLVLVALLLLALPRSRPELDAEQPATSAVRYREYLTRLCRLLVLSAACANASLLVASLQVWEIARPNLAVTFLSYLPLGVALVAWALFAFRAGDAGNRLAGPAEESSGYVQRDDDSAWHLAGMVYLNRADPAVLVHRRVGTYYTLNLGNPISWLVLAAAAAVSVLAGTGVIELPRRG